MPGSLRFAPAQPRHGLGPGRQPLPGGAGQPSAGEPAPQKPNAAPFIASASGNLSQAQLGRVASALVIPSAELERDARAGKTLAVVGQERGKAREEVRTDVLDALIDAR